MEHVLDTYKLPYNEDIPVVCMDESPKQLIEEIASEPISQGREARVDYEYIRHGMVNVFMANEPLKGKISDEMYPEAKKIILVMDNYNTHDASAFYETYPPEEAKRLWDRFDFVYTPKHGSWLNMAEIELHVLNGQCLNRHLPTMDKVIEEVKAWEKHRNNKNKKINWQFTNEQARTKLKRLYPSYSS